MNQFIGSLSWQTLYDLDLYHCCLNFILEAILGIDVKQKQNFYANLSRNKFRLTAFLLL